MYSYIIVAVIIVISVMEFIEHVQDQVIALSFDVKGLCLILTVKVVTIIVVQFSVLDFLKSVLEPIYMCKLLQCS